jgi:hypothetical protein
VRFFVADVSRSAGVLVLAGRSFAGVLLSLVGGVLGVEVGVLGVEVVVLGVVGERGL